jgi:predicted glycoside hydrolase/deacetylase ChbG (UPF0249 family)
MNLVDESIDLFFEYFKVQESSDSYSMFREFSPYIAEFLLKRSSLSEVRKNEFRVSIKDASWLEEVNNNSYYIL